jgi:hypothetical protein
MESSTKIQIMAQPTKTVMMATQIAEMDAKMTAPSLRMGINA